ncbi:nickel pincer cofactor biosynthesis protein LarC [Lujinxingia vulgaris]|uniref:Putative nickel insertion protein n=1 Tax=Lujinxingia vulgaris TaxID=2600176 RepID=A0A5C6X0S5_9DELT|nr:nickel pincer cofactor biosynthesis protein LarC [Lujinxingia vulgaris]TXD35461.1 nickel pincer cofactor biosynthesis protein LarC [Lujinxingia vulgaris]
MATHIHLDLLGGLAGDMFLAAAIDADLVDVARLEAALQSVGLGPVRVISERVVRGAIEGVHVRFEGWDPAMESDHRHLSTIEEMIAASALSEGVKRRATAMFRTLGQAEATVHGIALERVHFHEVGAVDSILDFVAAAWVIEEVDATFSFGAIPVGSGTIETAHGTIPVPAPATAKLLEGFELTYQDVATEFVTPTGAAILATVAAQPGERQGRLKASGFGCGTREFKSHSNVVRVVVMEQGAASQGSAAGDAELWERDEVVQLVCEIDDLQPELMAAVEAQLFDAGALDVVREPVLMKKGRSGERLSVLCEAELSEALLRVIFVHTTTFGVRVMPVSRVKLRRSRRLVETTFGQVHVKVGWLGDEAIKATPEFEDCRLLAERHHLPVHTVYLEAQRAAAALITDLSK